MAFTAFADADVVAQAPRRKSRVALLLLLPGLAYLALFFLVPLFALLLTSFQEIVIGPAGKDYVQAFRWENYVEVVGTYRSHILRSFGYAVLATVIALLIGYPLAYFMGVTLRDRPLLKSLTMVLVIAPFFISFLLRTLAWKQIFSDEGVVVSSLQAIGLMGPNDYLTGTPFSVVFGLTYTFIPFMTLPIYTSLERLDLRYLEAGADLYGRGGAIFWRVTLPLSAPGVISGTLLTFIPASGDYVNASREFLGGTGTSMIGNVIESNFLVRENYPAAAALSIILMAVILVLVGFYVRRSGTEDLI